MSVLSPVLSLPSHPPLLEARVSPTGLRFKDVGTSEIRSFSDWCFSEICSQNVPFPASLSADQIFRLIQAQGRTAYFEVRNLFCAEKIGLNRVQIHEKCVVVVIKLARKGERGFYGRKARPLAQPRGGWVKSRGAGACGRYEWQGDFYCV